ncbi:MAG: flagellar biosynthesis protein FlhA [Oscillospiraceae bacterium]|nr:flagellar biosynthesis protein FlhA [Oscillospiraceae bacterium]
MFIDILITANLAISLYIFFAAMFTKNFEKFLRVFPSIFIGGVVFRMVLNLFITSRILSHSGTGAIIEAVGGFVTGGDSFAGSVVFAVFILTAHIVVIIGAMRISAVMGKQSNTDLHKSVNACMRFAIAEILVLFITIAVNFIAGALLHPAIEIYGFTGAAADLAPIVVGSGICMSWLAIMSLFGAGMFATRVVTKARENAGV